MSAFPALTAVPHIPALPGRTAPPADTPTARRGRTPAPRRCNVTRCAPGLTAAAPHRRPSRTTTRKPARSCSPEVSATPTPCTVSAGCATRTTAPTPRRQPPEDGTHDQQCRQARGLSLFSRHRPRPSIRAALGRSGSQICCSRAARGRISANVGV